MLEYAIVLVLTVSGASFEFLLGNTYVSPRECDRQAEEFTSVLQPAASPYLSVTAYCISQSK